MSQSSRPPAVDAPLKRRPPLWTTIKAVLWAFLGVRQRQAFSDDVVRLNPVHLVVTGVLMTFVFVVGLMFFVHWVAG
jgi:hypothetical protein